MSAEIEIVISSREKRKRAPIVSSTQPLCGICKTQFSRYTCPHCNLHYCSLPCFRATAHATCTEHFDKKTLEDDIKSGKDKSGDEKKAMLDMLKRFEEEDLRASEEQAAEASDEEEDAQRRELERRLEGMDLDSLSADELLKLLSPAQREAFETALADPSKAAALVDDEFESQAPWWTNSEEVEEGSSVVKPEILAEELLPLLKIGQDGRVAVHPNLVYNLVALLFVYTLTLRSFSLSSFTSLPPNAAERVEAIEMIARLAPFLAERSNTVLEDVGSAIAYGIARQDPDSINPELLALLLNDVSTLLLPAAISPLSETSTASRLSSHPSSTALVALSDLLHLFSPPPDSIKHIAPLPKAAKLVRPKLLFYAAFLASSRSPVSSQAMRGIAMTLRREAEKREREEQERLENVEARKDTSSSHKGAGRDEGIRIIEIME